MTAERRIATVAALLQCLCGLLTGCAKFHHGYNRVEPSSSYGSVDFPSGPTRSKLGFSLDRKVSVGDIGLAWDSNQVILPERTSKVVYRERAVEESGTRWLNGYLFGSSGIKLKNPAIVFPEAIEKRRVNAQVADSVARVYPVTILLKGVRPMHGRNDEEVEPVEVVTCTFTSKAMRCYGLLEGGVLNGVQDEKEHTAIVEKVIRASARRSRFSLQRVTSKAGYYEIVVSGHFEFEGGRHIFTRD